MKKKIEDNCVELDERLDKEIKQTECQNDRDKKKPKRQADGWRERKTRKKGNGYELMKKLKEQ